MKKGWLGISLSSFCVCLFCWNIFGVLIVFSRSTNYRPGIVKALEDFKFSVYGEDYNEENEACEKVTEASRKRKAATENAKEKFSKYEWGELAQSGQVLTIFANYISCWGLHFLNLTKCIILCALKWALMFLATFSLCFFLTVKGFDSGRAEKLFGCQQSSCYWIQSSFGE